jgi:hypothetical protein
VLHLEQVVDHGEDGLLTLLRQAGGVERDPADVLGSEGVEEVRPPSGGGERGRLVGVQVGGVSGEAAHILVRQRLQDAGVGARWSR